MPTSFGFPTDGAERKFELSNNSLLYQEVVNSIFRALIEGRIAPGERLVEADIANELNVSRSPVRQALQEMARQGIVVLVPRIGASVATWSPTEIEDFCRLRVRIEALAAEQAAFRIESSELRRLSGLIDAMRLALSPLHLEDLIESDLAFHRLVVEASHNASLVHIYDFMVLRIRMFMIVEKHIYPSDPRQAAMEETHRRIYGALQDRAPDRARQLMEDHIDESADGLIGRMQRGVATADSAAVPTLVESILKGAPVCPSPA